MTQKYVLTTRKDFPAMVRVKRRQFRQACALEQDISKTGSKPTHLDVGRRTSRIENVNSITKANGLNMTREEFFTNCILPFYQEINSIQKKIDVRKDELSDPKQFDEKIALMVADIRIVNEVIYEFAVEFNLYVNSDMIDLHYMRIPHALAFLEYWIREIEYNPNILPKDSLRPHTLTVVTGVGNHSKKINKPSIRSEVEKWLADHKYKVQTVGGCLLVIFPEELFATEK